MALERGHLQRVAKTSTLRVDAGAPIQQQLHRCSMALERRRLQAVAELSVPGVDVGALVQQQL